MKNYKRVIAAAACAATAAVMCATMLACSDGSNNNNGGTENSSYTVAMPDGAPALAAAQLMVEDMQFGGEVEYKVVNSNAIGAQVSQGAADVVILPVNAAAQLAGSGEKYKMLGTVTHGNLYMISNKYTQEITSSNLSSLVGKTVGCIQLESFVGSVFKMILQQNGIAFKVVESAGMAEEGVVNLINIADPATGVSPSAEFDYMIAAEPLVTNKIKGSASAASPLKQVADIQSLYGKDGYPQAVMVAKAEVIEDSPEFVADLCEAMGENAEWVVSSYADMTGIVNAISACYGSQSSLNANALSAAVISRCAIEFTPAADCKQLVTEFIDKYEAVNNVTIAVSDAFFYTAA